MERPAVRICWKVARVRLLLAALRCAGALALLSVLGGCSASKFIDLYAADYRDTAATAGDAQLLLNILRAKDDLPIHFSDLSVIHGSIQLTAGSNSSLPFAHFMGSQTPSQVNPNFIAQSAPSFDLGTLDTQDFTRGMLSQVDVNTIKTLFDQGIDPRLLLILFFSEYDGPNGDRYLNNTQCELTHREPSREPGCWLHMYDYLGKVNALIGGRGIYARADRREMQANVYQVLKPVAGPLAGSLSMKDNLSDLTQIDLKKFRLKGNRLYSISDPQLAICHYGKDRKLHPIFLTSAAGNETCTEDEVIYTPVLDKKNAGLAVRSPYEVLQFLGQVLRFQEEVKGFDPNRYDLNRCITLDPDRDQRHCDTGEVLFQVNASGGIPAVTTKYGGASYSVNYKDCNKLGDQPCDYSLQILAIVELLINANKSASDIISTPRVQVVR